MMCLYVYILFFKQYLQSSDRSKLYNLSFCICRYSSLQCGVHTEFACLCVGVAVSCHMGSIEQLEKQARRRGSSVFHTSWEIFFLVGVWLHPFSCWASVSESDSPTYLAILLRSFSYENSALFETFLTWSTVEQPYAKTAVRSTQTCAFADNGGMVLAANSEACLVDEQSPDD